MRNRIAQPSRRILYDPPTGTYDLPFTWAFNASGLTVGKDYPNQFIYLLGGYGDFVCRRMVGMSQILDTAAGQFQVKNRNSNYLQSEKVYSQRWFDQMLVPEELYPELGAIRFDLFNFNPSGLNAPGNAQLAFQGVRRMKGTLTRPAYRYREKSYTYILQATLTQTYPASPVTVSQVINDYDFDLYNIILLKQTSPMFASLTYTGEENVGPHLVAVMAGPTGNLISLNMIQAGNNTPASISVVGNAITINVATDAFGGISSTNAQMVTLINGFPAAAALVTASTTSPGALTAANGGIEFLSGGGFSGGATAITDPICQVWLYDENRVQTSNIPINDVYINGGPGSAYVNGAIVPRLYYRQQSRIQLDLYSLVKNAGTLPQGVLIYLVGKQLEPC